MGASIAREFESLDGWVIALLGGQTAIGYYRPAIDELPERLSPVFAFVATYVPQPQGVIVNRVAVPFLTMPSIEHCPINSSVILIPCEKLSFSERRGLLECLQSARQMAEAQANAEPSRIGQ